MGDSNLFQQKHNISSATEEPKNETDVVDIDPKTSEETDRLVEEILNSWDKWFDSPPDERKEELKELQNERRKLYDQYQQEHGAERERDIEKIAELREQLVMLDKKIYKKQRTIIKELWQNSSQQ